MAKKGDFKQERMFGRVAKIPISNTSNELVGMVFWITGIYRLPCTFEILFAIFGNSVFRSEKERRTNGGTGKRASAVSDWMAVFGTPEIMAPDKDSIFIGGIFHDFRTEHNVVLQVVISGHRQSLGATERRHRLFRTIIDHVVGNKKPENLSNKGWKEFAAMTMMRLNSQVQQSDGFAHGEEFLGERQNCQ